jgi:N6-adenosine-specific RNA methylase IME4
MQNEVESLKKQLEQFRRLRQEKHFKRQRFIESIAKDIYGETSPRNVTNTELRDGSEEFRVAHTTTSENRSKIPETSNLSNRGSSVEQDSYNSANDLNSIQKKAITRTSPKRENLSQRKDEKTREDQLEQSREREGERKREKDERERERRGIKRRLSDTKEHRENLRDGAFRPLPLTQYAAESPFIYSSHYHHFYEMSSEFPPPAAPFYRSAYSQRFHSPFYNYVMYPPYMFPPSHSYYSRERHFSLEYDSPESRQDFEKESTNSSSLALLLKNDYSQHFVDTGERPQNFIRDADINERFEEYPKMKELIRLKEELIKLRATPPFYIRADLKTFDLTSLGTKFDVILIDPPLKEYYMRRAELVHTKWNEPPFWTYEEIANLNIGAIGENPSFVFLWVGSAEGLDEGRTILKKWGYRRSEDIVWVKTNLAGQATSAPLHDKKSIFRRTKEHCLMGIKGTVRRNQDGHLIHANIDTDVIVAEEPCDGSTKKPEELYDIIEHFCLGRRRLELFGEDHNIRPGWVTIGSQLTSTNWNKESYLSYFQGDSGHLLGTLPDIEKLRPKSPTRNDANVVYYDPKKTVPNKGPPHRP